MKQNEFVPRRSLEVIILDDFPGQTIFSTGNELNVLFAGHRELKHSKSLSSDRLETDLAKQRNVLHARRAFRAYLDPTSIMLNNM